MLHVYAYCIYCIKDNSPFHTETLHYLHSGGSPDLTPLAASEKFTQRQMRRIGAGSLHPNGTVNGATDCY